MVSIPWQLIRRVAAFASREGSCHYPFDLAWGLSGNLGN